MHWKASVCAYQPSYEVIFPCSDGPLRCIYTVNIWGHQLVYNIFFLVIFLKDILSLIIHPREPWYVSPIGQVLNFLGVGFQYIAPGPTLEVFF